MTLDLPIRTISENNAREHHMARARRRKTQRTATAFRLLAELRGKRPSMPAVVTLVRIAPRALDGDNLQGALKAVRDGVADALAVDDGSPLITWRYEQAKGKPKEYGVKIRVDSLP